ncbi:MAG: class I SAM-dependent methyltransferase [bacterium]|nr:class I SAM-dependent methyltransferase [bacterium]
MLRKMVKKIPGAKKLARALGLIPRHTDHTDDRGFLLEMLPKDSIGAEIGVHMGDFTRQILEKVSPKELHLIDPWKHEASSTYKNAWYGGQAENGQKEMDERYSKVCDRFDGEISKGIVKVDRGFSTDILNQLPDDYLDWVYIDGNHLYEYVKKDLELAFQKTKPGGYITGDDYTDGGWWEGGVKKAVDEFAKTDSMELIEIRNGQFIFRKK